jgi:lysine 2,3-aminomutase
MPNYLVSMSDDAVILRNYEGMLIRYQAEDKPGTINPTATRGVSGLLQGDKTALIPEGNERMARRKPQVATTDCGGDIEVPSDGDGQRRIIPLTLLKGGSNGNGPAASNG